MSKENTVTISTELYNEYRDYFRETRNDKVEVETGFGRRYYLDETDVITELKEKIDKLRELNNTLEDELKSAKRMSIWKFLKWRY